MNLRIITKKHAADPEIGFLTKSISKAYGRTTSIPPAWKLSPQMVPVGRFGLMFLVELGASLHAQ